MIHHIHTFIKQFPLILEFITAVSAIIVLVKFNTHTKKTENVEMQHLYIDQLRNITNEAHELLNKIQETKILDIMSLLEEKKYEEIFFDDIKKLRILIIECDNSVKSIKDPTFKASDYFDTDEDTINKIDPKTALSEQESMLSDFIASSSSLIFEYGDHLNKDNNEAEEVIASINALRGYLLTEENDSESSTAIDSELANNSSDPKIMILMVAMRETLDDKSWSEQSLGDWRMSKTKASEIPYILGINVETRNVVSLTRVDNPKFIRNNDKPYYRFETDSSEQVYQQIKGKQELPIKLDEATHWNPRNPIRYIYRTEQELGDIRTLLKDSLTNA